MSEKKKLSELKTGDEVSLSFVVAKGCSEDCRLLGEYFDEDVSGGVVVDLLHSESEYAKVLENKQNEIDVLQGRINKAVSLLREAMEVVDGDFEYSIISILEG